MPAFKVRKYFRTYRNLFQFDQQKTQFHDLLVYVIGWSTVVFVINSASNAVRKCEIVRGEAECYFTLPDCIVSAIITNTTVWSILLQINYIYYVNHRYCSC